MKYKFILFSPWLLKRPVKEYPRGSIYTSIMELGPERPSLLWFWDPTSIMGVFMDPVGTVDGQNPA